MAGRFALSLAAADVLGERLGADLRVFPLQIPHHGLTDAERAQVAATVMRQWETCGLAHHGKPQPAVADAFAVLARPALAVGMIVVSAGGGQQILVRLGSDRRIAVLAVQQAETLHMEFVRPTGLVHALMAYLPNAKPFPGRSVTFPREDQPHDPSRCDDDTAVRIMEEARPILRGYAAQRDAARIMLERSRHGAGMITVFGRRHHTEPLLWFDTDKGRFTEYAHAEADGQVWESYTPVDNARLAQQIAELLDTAHKAGGVR